MFKIKPYSFFISKDPYSRVRDFVLLFLLLVWFINPSNKIVVLFFIFFAIFLSFLTKKFDVSLILTFFLSSFFSVGKTYFIQLLDLEQFSNLRSLYPLGLVSQIQISISDVFFSILVIYTLFLIYRKRINLKRMNLIDFSLIFFFLFGILSDVISSNKLFFSLLLKKELFKYIFMYFFIKFNIKDHQFLWKSFLGLITSLVLFETFIALQQSIYGSPIGNALEATFSIESFGGVPDEPTFVFRPIGTFIHTNLFAMFLSALLPFFIFFMIKSEKYFHKITFFLVIVCLVLTLSRAAWLATIISSFLIIFYFEYYKKIRLGHSLSLKRIALCLFLALPLLFYSVPRIVGISNILQEGGGLNLRIKQANEVLTLIGQHPVFGTGTGLSVIKAIQNNPGGVFASFPSEIHNYPLLLAVENGLPYLGFFTLFLVLSFKKLISYKNTPAFISFSGLMAMIIIGLFQPFFINQLLFILLALDYDKISKISYAF